MVERLIPRMTNSIDFEGILQAVAASSRVLLTCHLAPDGDALGSLLALNSLVRRMGKETQMICNDAVPDYLQFLPGADAIALPAAAEGQAFDLAISIDSSDLERLGASGPAFMKVGNTIQMDHHRTNTRFASKNLVMDELPASGCLMCLLFEASGLPYTREEAICLYTAVSTDTGNFCFGNLTARIFEQMADLMRAGLPLIETARALHLMKAKENVLLLGRALSSLRMSADGRLSGMRLTRDDFAFAKADSEHADRLVNYALYMPGVKLAYLACEEEGGVKLSFRAIAPYEVASVAAALGGGGHKQASGCTIHLPLDEAIQLVEQKLRDLLDA